MGAEGEAGSTAGADDDTDRGSMHRLCPTYAQDINSPLRHVRTRIYFTSESHVHSLVNVLRFSHLGECPPLACTSKDLKRKASVIEHFCEDTPHAGCPSLGSPRGTARHQDVWHGSEVRAMVQP